MLVMPRRRLIEPLLLHACCVSLSSRPWVVSAFLPRFPLHMHGVEWPTSLRKSRIPVQAMDTLFEKLTTGQRTSTNTSVRYSVTV